MTLFDLIALCLILGSALIGFVRGAIREVMTILAFFLAALIAIFALRFTGPLSRKLIDPDWAATALAVVLSFVLAYIALRVSGSFLTKKIHNIETLGALDRSAGVGFGLIRALVLLGVFYLVFNAATPYILCPFPHVRSMHIRDAQTGLEYFSTRKRTHTHTKHTHTHTQGCSIRKRTHTHTTHTLSHTGLLDL